MQTRHIYHIDILLIIMALQSAVEEEEDVTVMTGIVLSDQLYIY